MKAWMILVTPLDPNEIKREFPNAWGKEKKLPGYYLDKGEAKRDLEKAKRSRKYKRCRIIRYPKHMMKLVKAAEKLKTEQEAKAAAEVRRIAELTPEERVKRMIANVEEIEQQRKEYEEYLEEYHGRNSTDKDKEG